MSKMMAPTEHFIKEITVMVNGKKIETKKFKMQDSNSGQMTAFIVTPLKKGDKITVDTKCSIKGFLRDELIVK